MVLLHTTGHVAACDTRRRELFCFVCSDYVYDADFDTAMLVRHVRAYWHITTCYLRRLVCTVPAQQLLHISVGPKPITTGVQPSPEPGGHFSGRATAEGRL